MSIVQQQNFIRERRRRLKELDKLRTTKFDSIAQDSDFQLAILNNQIIIDQSLIIEELLFCPKAQVTFPRRWGKSFNLSVINAFFEMELDPSGQPVPQDLCINRKLFEMGTFDASGNKVPMKIMASQEAIDHFGQYIVLKLDLQNMSGSYQELFSTLSSKISQLYSRFQFLEQLVLSEHDAEIIHRGISCAKTDTITNSDVAFLKSSLQQLARILYNYYYKYIVILVDEYDCPSINILQGISDHEEQKKALSLFKDLFGNAIKGCQYVRFAMLTGILRLGNDVSLAPLNVHEFSMVRSESFAPYYGFTHDQVSQLFQIFQIDPNSLEKVQQMYNGYHFGTEDLLYNPWAVANCLNACIINRADMNSSLRPYWTNSGNVTYLYPIVLHPSVLDKFGQLLSSNNSLVFGFVDQLCGLHMKMLNDLLFTDQSKQLDNLSESQIGVLFTFLCQQGYFSINSVNGTACTVSLPNLEVRMEISKLISLAIENSELSSSFNAVKMCIENFIQEYNQVESLDTFAQDLQTLLYRFITELAMFADFDKNNSVLTSRYLMRNENIIQCLVTSCIHTIKSVRLGSVGSEVHSDGLKSGDIFLTYQSLAIVVELTFGQTADQALQQIHDKGYDVHLGPKYEDMCLIGINVMPNKDVSVAMEFRSKDRHYQTKKSTTSFDDCDYVITDLSF